MGQKAHGVARAANFVRRLSDGERDVASETVAVDLIRRGTA